jgi:hypothetical protein
MLPLSPSSTSSVVQSACTPALSACSPKPRKCQVASAWAPSRDRRSRTVSLILASVENPVTRCRSGGTSR